MKIPEAAVSFLSSRGLNLATAESCKAGLIASILPACPAAAHVWMSGLSATHHRAGSDRPVRKQPRSMTTG